MSDFLTTETEKFSDFITEQYPLAKKNGTGILSYAFELPKDKIIINPDAVLNRFNVSFLYEKPEQQFSIFSADPVFELDDSGEGRFAVIDKKIKDLKKYFLSNWDQNGLRDFPLFMGGMKFAVEHSDEDWKEFKDTGWFIPECTFLQLKGKQFFIFNTVIPFSKDASIKKFKQKLSVFLNQSTDNFNFPVRVSQINGNTAKEKKKWKSRVDMLLEKISEGEINKIVLSRVVELRLLDDLSFNYVLEKFRSNFPGCYLFIYKRNKSYFFGATPERLAEFRNSKVELDALAGSLPRGINEEEDLKLEKQLLKDSKILNEHNIVVKHLNKVLDTHLDEIITEDATILKLQNIQHVLTKISGYLKDENCMFNLVKEVFPTPAVCGFPKEKALQIIKKIEEHQRGMYSGIIGWFNLNGTAEFVIAIRSALYSNKKLLAYAGSGIVESSNPDEEFKETELKLQSVISLFNENKN